VLADGPTKTGPDFGKASPVGLLIVVLLLFGVFALVWSMNRHLKKIPESFDGRDGADGTTADRRDADGAGAESADAATPEHPSEPGG
jgi:hypothetical protein